MATTKFKELKMESFNSTTRQMIYHSLNYYTNLKKTQGGELITTINCSAEGAVVEFQLQQKIYEIEMGRPVEWSANGKNDGHVLYHIRQSFKPGEIEAEKAHTIGVELLKKFLGDKYHNYQCVITTHTDQKHIHNDVIFNAVGLNGKKYNSKIYGYKMLREINDRICEKNGLSVVIPSKDRRSRLYSKGATVSYRNELKNDFDNALSIAKSYDELISILSENYVIDDTHKHMTFRHRTNGQQRNIRSDSLGEKYAYEALTRRFDAINKIKNKNKNKIKLPFNLHLKAREKINIECNANMTYSQKLSHIRSLMVTLHTLNEFNVNCYQDITLQISSLDSQLADTETQIREATEKLDLLNSICKSCSIYSDTKPIYDAYQSSLLKDRFYSDNKDQLELYDLAKKHLQQMEISLDDFNIASIQSKLELMSSILNLLKESFNDTKNKFDRLTRTKTSVDEIKRVHPTSSKYKTKGTKKYVR